MPPSEITSMWIGSSVTMRESEADSFWPAVSWTVTDSTNRVSSAPCARLGHDSGRTNSNLALPEESVWAVVLANGFAPATTGTAPPSTGPVAVISTSPLSIGLPKK